MADNGSDPTANHKVIFQGIIAISAAFVASSVYRLIAICLCHRGQTTTVQNQLQLPNHAAIPRLAERTSSSTVQNQLQLPNHAAIPRLAERTSSSVAVAHRIPTHKYHKRDKVDVLDDESDTCAVCLGDFEEGEELKTMPECLHSFHVHCIDMWLHSHPSCPICRTGAGAGAAPLPVVSANHHSIDMNMAPLGGGGAVMQSGLLRW